MRKTHLRNRLAGSFAPAVLAACLAWPATALAAKGKTGNAKEPRKPQYIFYPSAPAESRLQFLAGYSTEADLGGGTSKFAQFLIGKEAPKRGLFKPYGLALADGKLFVADTGRHGISILDFEQRKFAYLDPTLEKALHTPINIRVDTDGTRYVADRGRNQVLIFGADDNLVGAIGDAQAPKTAWQDQRPASDAGPTEALKPLWPTDVAITADRLYVTDLHNNCVRVYVKTSRQFLFSIPRDGKDGPGQLFAPINLAVDAQGQLYVSDMGGFFVKKYDSEGRHLRTFGRAGDRPGEFARPKGLAVDREGRLYVVDAAAQLIQIFDPEGRLLLFFGEPGGSAAPLDLPTQVIVDYDHRRYFEKNAAPNFKLEYLVFVISQYGDRKVSVYGFGQRQ